MRDPTGFGQPSLIPVVLGKCDILLVPHQSSVSVGGKGVDTSAWMPPMKLFEYMASRRAIVASDLPVLREVLNERMAILVPPEDTHQWMEAIRMCEDRRFRETHAENAYNVFREDYTWQKRAERSHNGMNARPSRCLLSLY